MHSPLNFTIVSDELADNNTCDHHEFRSPDKMSKERKLYLSEHGWLVCWQYFSSPLIIGEKIRF